MTIEASDWLPVETLVDPRLAARLDKVVPKWSERWFGSANVCNFAGFARGKAGTKLPALANSWRVSDAGISCAWSEQLGLKLGLAIVDASDRNLPRSSSDKTLLTSLAWEALTDLAASAASSLGMNASSPSQKLDRQQQIGWQTRNLLKQLPELVFQMPASALVPARKALIGNAFGPEEMGEPLSEACANASLPVRAILGKATISWSDCRNLEMGDVVILDQALENSMALLAAKSGGEICKLSLNEDDGHLQLRVADYGA